MNKMKNNMQPVSTIDDTLQNIFNPHVISNNDKQLPVVLLLSSYPPRMCGIATYTKDLLETWNSKFSHSFKIKICALENGNQYHQYPKEVTYVLNTKNKEAYFLLAKKIQSDSQIKIILIQHEFGLFNHDDENVFTHFLQILEKPVVIVFHTILPFPDYKLKQKVKDIAQACKAIIVMTKNAAQILKDTYNIPNQKISVISHGVHLTGHYEKNYLKDKHGLHGKQVLSTFGLISSGKGIDTTLDALPDIIKAHNNVMFLIIGKTHPGVIEQEGEQYRIFLQKKVDDLKINNHVKFINSYLPLQELLEYLQLTDIYLFTSTDPNQAVSGTFSYAMSSGCAIISTPIPHAIEALHNDIGIIIDFNNSYQLKDNVIFLLNNPQLKNQFTLNTLQKIMPSSWQNTVILYMELFLKITGRDDKFFDVNNQKKFVATPYAVDYKLPEIDLRHIKKMTTLFGIIQFSQINQPDITSGYTLDDNARALIAFVMQYAHAPTNDNLYYVNLYLDFIDYCVQPEGFLLNYVDDNKKFTEQNNNTDLADANGRAVWALGYLIGNSHLFNQTIINKAVAIMIKVIPHIKNIHATRAMAFSIKGLYYYNSYKNDHEITETIELLADRLVQMYCHENEDNWKWYESYLTYANSVIPEAMLCAWLETHNIAYKNIAFTSFNFLLNIIFTDSGIKVIPNKTWLHKGQHLLPQGEQPVDVAYTIIALDMFYKVFKTENYLIKMKIAFNWFLGNNHLHQIVYNPGTAGCYDGVEPTHINMNQGAESSISYLIARLTIAKYFSIHYSNYMPHYYSLPVPVKDAFINIPETNSISI